MLSAWIHTEIKETGGGRLVGFILLWSGISERVSMYSAVRI